jgi:hypothetical protein
MAACATLPSRCGWRNTGAVLSCLSPSPLSGDAIQSSVAPTPTTLMTRLASGLVGSAAIIGELLVAFTGGPFALR